MNEGRAAETAEPSFCSADIDSRNMQRRERLTMPHPARLPRAGYRARVPPHVAKTMRPRRNERLAALARGLVPLCFSVLSGPESAFLFGPRSPIKLSGSFNRRGLSVAWPCSIYSAAPLIQSVVSLFDTQAPCLCRARRSHSRVAAILAAESLPCLVGCLACSECHRLAEAAEAAPISGLACDPLEPIPKVAIARCTELCLHV